MQQRRGQIAAHALRRARAGAPACAEAAPCSRIATSSSQRARKSVCADAIDARNSSNESITGRSHQSCVRWPKTTPMRAHVAVRSRQGTRPSTSTSPDVGDEDAGEHLDRGGLAGAVGPDVADQLAAVDGED